MRKVLVIAYYFPPTGMGGVPPIVKWCKYLPKFGWFPVVLTVKDIDYFAYDDELLQEVTCQVFRTESLDPLRLSKVFSRGKRNFAERSKRFKKLSDIIFMPDNKIGWLPFAVTEGIRIINKENIDAIFSIAPPYTSLLIGYFLKKICKIPFICDFRDRWPLSPYPTLLHSKVGEFLKMTMLREADKVSVVSKDVKTELLKIHQQKAKDFTVIPHGYDPDDFKIKPLRRKDKFTIAHTGSFVKGRTPLYFLKAIADLITNEKIPKNDLDIEFTGFYTKEEQKIVQELNLGDLVHFHSYLPRKEYLQYLISSDILWLTLDKREEVTLPGKIGEYFGARKPILATVLENSCAELVRNTEAGIVVPPQDIGAIKTSIYDFYLKFKNKELKITPLSKIEGFSWINLTKRLSKIFDGVVGKVVLEQLNIKHIV